MADANRSCCWPLGAGYKRVSAIKVSTDLVRARANEEITPVARQHQRRRYFAVATNDALFSVIGLQPKCERSSDDDDVPSLKVVGC